MNKFISATAVLAMVATASAPAFASDDTVFGFSPYYTQKSIEAQGFNVIDVSEWGNMVVATVVDDAGHRSFKYFNPEGLGVIR